MPNNSQSNSKPTKKNSILQNPQTPINVDNPSQNNAPNTIQISPPFQLHYPNVLDDQQQIPLVPAPNNPGILPPLFFNPFFTQPDMIHPIDFNYLNQGIFIPQTAENNQFFFIPGNIAPEIDHTNPQSYQTVSPFSLPENDDDLSLIESENMLFSESQKFIHHTDNNTSQPFYFVPNLENDEKPSIHDSLKDNGNYETFLVPVKIKKETNGNIELLPESNTEIPNHLMSPEQLNILNKIHLIKNQSKSEIKSENATEIVKFDESFVDHIDETSVAESRTIIENIVDKIHGYMMVRFNKIVTREPSIIESELNSKTVTSNSLRLSVGESFKSNRDENSIIHVKKKRKSNTQVLSLSAYLDKNLQPSTQTTSRFRRLRLDDKTNYWHMDSVSCLDTKMREIPVNIVQLSGVNSVEIPPEVIEFFKQQEITNNIEESSTFCEHNNLEGDKFKENDSKVSKLRQWMYMCSMNNCEFLECQKRI